MFIEITNFDGNVEFINSDQVTKVFTHKDVTRINLTDGSYVITKLWPDEIMEIIHES